MTLEEQYIAMYEVVKESRDLLAEKLYSYQLITEEQYENAPFYDLLQCIDPEEMHSYKILNLPNEPIEDPSIPHIQSQTELTNYLYKNNNSKIITKELSLVDLNYILLKKTLFYKEYLKYHLQNMNIDKALLRKAKSIKDLIKLLDHIDRKKYTQIEYNIDDTLYYKVTNEIQVSVIDDSNKLVFTGDIEIYLNNIFYKKVKTLEPIYILPWKTGENTIKIKYIPTDRYFASETENISFTVEKESLIPHIILKNTNPNSHYYNIDYEDNEPIEGYSTDTWDLDIIITNMQGEQVEKEIPFKIYLENNEYTLFDENTNNDGTKHFTNITIPYYNANFINMETDEIDSINVLDEPLEYTDDEILNNLTFITSINFENNLIRFTKKTFSPDNFLDDLNGCITDLHIQNGNIRWNIFHTNQHIKIEYLNDIKKTIGSIVTNIIYDSHISYNILYIETAQKRQVDIIYVPKRKFLNLYIETNLNSLTYNNDSNVYQIGLYYPALDIDDNLLTWYKDSPTQPTKIPIKMIDMYTGKIQANNDHKLITIANDETIVFKDYFNTPRYDLIPSNELPYGKTNLTINICTNTPSYISQTINWENATSLSFYYQSDEFGILDVYIGSNKIGSLTPHKNWTQFTYNNIQNLFTNTTNYQRQLRIINVISFTHIYIDDIVIDNSNLINGDFENGLQGWTVKGGVSYAEHGRNDDYCLDLLNTKYCNVINKYFDIKSNFEIPEQTLFYYKYAPTIYYKPLGNVDSKQIILTTNNVTQSEITEENGQVPLMTEIGEYNITIQGDSDEVTERRNYSYEIKKPFDIINLTNSTKEAKYQVKIYDLKHTYDIQVLNSNNDVTSVCQLNRNVENDVLYLTITIPRNNSTLGDNILKITMNNYSEEETFTISIPEAICVTNVAFNSDDDLIVTTINRVNINNTNVVSNVELTSDNDLKITTKTIKHSYDNIQDIVTDIQIEKDNLVIITYNEDD